MNLSKDRHNPNLGTCKCIRVWVWVCVCGDASSLVELTYWRGHAARAPTPLSESVGSRGVDEADARS